jgi:uncharacterized delta-60 repeat protein
MYSVTHMQRLQRIMKFIFFMLTVANAIVANAQMPGTPDSTFGRYGIVQCPGPYAGTAQAIATQIDGRIVLAGNAVNVNSGGSSTHSIFTVARLNDDGSFDAAFGIGGITQTNINGMGPSVANGVAIQTDGKIILTGNSNNGITDHFAIARYNTNGMLDTLFGVKGIVITPIGSWSSASSVSLLNDGKIIVIGESNPINQSIIQPTVAKYTTNGSLDSTFGTNGIAVMSPDKNYASVVYAGVLQPNNKIIAVGSISTGMYGGFGAVRFNPDGTTDSTFGTDGKAVTDFGSSSIAFAVSLQNNGKIVAAGWVSGDNAFAIARYNADGILDTTFGTGGKVITKVGTSGYNEAHGIALQSNGKIDVAGKTQTYDLGLVRYNSNGMLDTTFGIGGKVISAWLNAYAICVQPNGKIVVAGDVGSSNRIFAAARYNVDNLVTVENSVTKNSIKIYPNPFSSTTVLQTDKILQNAILTIYNATGQRVKQIDNFTGQAIIFSRDNLPSGLYMIRLTQNNKISSTNKLVIIDN